MKDMVRVGLADDDKLVRRALGAIIDDIDDLHLVWTVDDGQQVLDTLASGLPEKRVDVVLLDVQMPVLDGIATCQRLHELHPDLPVIMLTTFRADDFLSDALRAGAVGFLTKDEAPDRIGDAIRAALRGTGVFSPSATRLLSAPPALPSTPAPAANPLTTRENEILVLVAESLTNQQIARRLGISEATVKTHISAIITKLGCLDRVGMVTWAFRNGAL